MNTEFMQIIDELCLVENDPELKEGIKWIDDNARKQGIDFYEMALRVIRTHMSERKARDWLNKRY